jgi:hypothetical protein
MRGGGYLAVVGVGADLALDLADLPQIWWREDVPLAVRLVLLVLAARVLVLVVLFGDVEVFAVARGKQVAQSTKRG